MYLYGREHNEMDFHLNTSKAEQEIAALKSKELTKAEAISKMLKGNKVTHRFFTTDEWITIEHGKIVTEDGARCKPFEFWADRQAPSWETGWSLITEK